MDEWKPIDGWPQYEVSRDGRVRKGACTVGQWESDQGYCLIRLSAPRATLRVHRLVATAFVPNPDNKPFVNHIDCRRNNNMADNLEWCTQWENLRHSDRMGRMQRDYWTGKRSPSATLSDDQVRAIREAYAEGGQSWEAIGRLFGISKRTAGRVINAESYSDVQ